MAITCPSAPSRWMAPTRWLPRSGRSATSRWRCRSGSLTCASSAASACSSAHMPSSAPSWLTQRCWKRPPRPSRPRRPPGKKCPICAMPCRSRLRTAPAAPCAWKFARPRIRPRLGARLSTWPSSSRCASLRAPTGTSSSVYQKWTAPSSTCARSRIPNCSSPCSSSRWPALAAARPPTSSCSRSSSATAPWWPTPPAARPFTAATCPLPRGRPTKTGAARPGRTRCSKTTPSLAWACA